MAVNEKKRKCSKGYNCGSTCISTTKACRLEFPDGVSVSIDESRKVIYNKTKKVKPKAVPVSSEPKDIEFNEAKANVRKKYKKFTDRLDEIEKRKGPPSSKWSDYDAVMTDLRKEAMRKKTKEDERWGTNTPIAFRPGTSIKIKTKMWVTEALQDFHTMFGNSKINLEAVQMKPDIRASWSEGIVSLDSNANKKTTRSVLFHEAGHGLENGASKLALSFLKSRGVNIEKDKGEYAGRPDEKLFANTDKAGFISEYVGRSYRDSKGEVRGTEVVSMALQHFSSVQDMTTLYSKDPDLFYLGMSLLND